MEDIIGPLIILIVLIVFGFSFLFFTIFMVVSGRKARKKAMKNQADKLAQHNAIEYGGFSHAVGLPVAENVKSDVYYCTDKIVIETSGTVFKLPFDKINDITMKSDVQIQQAYVSSVGGAVGGAVLFGPLGAMVGGRAKKKKTTTTTLFLIITYEKEEKIDYIAFEVGGSITNANKIMKLFGERPKLEKREIIL